MFCSTDKMMTKNYAYNNVFDFDFWSEGMVQS